MSEGNNDSGTTPEQQKQLDSMKEQHPDANEQSMEWSPEAALKAINMMNSNIQTLHNELSSLKVMFVSLTQTLIDTNVVSEADMLASHKKNMDIPQLIKDWAEGGVTLEEATQRCLEMDIDEELCKKVYDEVKFVKKFTEESGK